MQGGIPQGHICIVAQSGAMKSSVTFCFHTVLYGETSGIYVTLEQGKDSLRSFVNMGMNVDDPVCAIESQSSTCQICVFNLMSKA